MHEKRLHKRKLVNAKVILRHPRIGEKHTYTHDISNGGVFALVNDLPDLPLGSVIELQFPDSGTPDIIFNMAMVRIDKQGMGLKFLNYKFDGKTYEMDNLRKLWSKQ